MEVRHLDQDVEIISLGQCCHYYQTYQTLVVRINNIVICYLLLSMISMPLIVAYSYQYQAFIIYNILYLSTAFLFND